MLSLSPITLKEACAFVGKLHRHHKPPQGGLFAIACCNEDQVCAVAIVGRPVARMNDNGYTAEVTRLCSDGTKNCCSMLYRACWRAAKAMGYKRLITYTLTTESGVSLKASGAQLIGESKGGSWSRPGRPRVDTHPTQAKFCWEFSDEKP